MYFASIQKRVCQAWGMCRVHSSSLPDWPEKGSWAELVGSDERCPPWRWQEGSPTPSSFPDPAGAPRAPDPPLHDYFCPASGIGGDPFCPPGTAQALRQGPGHVRPVEVWVGTSPLLARLQAVFLLQCAAPAQSPPSPLLARLQNPPRCGPATAFR